MAHLFKIDGRVKYTNAFVKTIFIQERLVETAGREDGINRTVINPVRDVCICSFAN